MEIEQIAIPNDLLKNSILIFTPVKTIIQAATVCHEWNKVSSLYLISLTKKNNATSTEFKMDLKLLVAQERVLLEKCVQ